MYENYPHYLLLSDPVLRTQEKLTEASCILDGMLRDDKQAFERALNFEFITEDMSHEERKSCLYAFCKYGPFEDDPIEGDAYASAEEWQALWDSTKRRVAKYELTGELY